jgi:serine/threonine-protein kinase
MRELSPGQTLDQYEIEDVIARSGMATIFKARDLDSGRTVVLKVPHIQFEADVVFHKRFEREEQIGLRLDHPSIVKALQPKEKSRVYIVQEFVEGESLRNLLHRERRLPIDTAVERAVQIDEALEYLHGQGVVHRDLKPENVMLTPNGGFKLMDFGIAFDAGLRKMTWSGLSETTGTPDYMAPEQVEGKRGDPRSDIYSLGVILYEMLTGRVPYDSGNALASMREKVVRNAPSPRRWRPEISPGLEEVVLMALERDPSKRPDSAFEFKEMLTHPESMVIAGQARLALPTERFTPRARKFLAIAAAAGASALLIGALWLVSLFTPSESGATANRDSAWNRPPH